MALSVNVEDEHKEVLSVVVNRKGKIAFSNGVTDHRFDAWVAIGDIDICGSTRGGSTYVIV